MIQRQPQKLDLVLLGKHQGLLLSIAFFSFTLVLSAGCRKSSQPTSPGPAALPSPPTSVVEDGDVSAAVATAETSFVGSEACRECHGEISAAYDHHSMGNSAMALAGNTPFPPAAQSAFHAPGFDYQMQKEQGNWLHIQKRAGAASESTTIALPVTHLIGSGKNGQSFLVNRDGFLFMSPMTWYPAKGVWDLSPGYETKNSQFNRPVVEECLYCHTDGANAKSGTMNQFHDPIVRAHAIGCERCHGPGKTHIESVQSDTHLASETIVNPADLNPELREAVCQQCHLSGAIRILKPHRNFNDYRPGEPLHETYSTFTIKQDGKEFVGHVEQMYESRCFQDSNGRLGCTSCHDPHSLPTPDQKLSFYRDRCVGCHSSEAGQVGCSLDLEQRTTQSPQDNCVQCHMPDLPTEIRHAAVTDHTVPRVPRTHTNTPIAGTGRQLQAFPDTNVDTAVATAREKSIALVNLSARYPELMGAAIRGAVARNLENISNADKTDYMAADALAAVYWDEGRSEDALEICQQVVASAPARESTLQIMGQIYSQTGRHQKAAATWEQLLVINPWMSSYWYSLGRSYAALERWTRCKQLATQGKQRFPTSMGLRHLLLECYLELGDLESADVEFREMESFAPPKFEALKKWFELHPARQ